MKVSSNLVIVLALNALWLTGCDPHVEATAHHPHHKIVVTSPKAMDVSIVQEYVCQIHSRRHIEVCALEAGYLEQIPIREGQPVRAGDLLFRILPTLYRAKLDAELAEVRTAEVELENSKKLFQDKVVSQVDVALHEAKLSKARADAKLAEAELNFTTITAPFDGIVDRLHEQQGSLVEEGDMLTTLSDNALMWVYFNVPEARYLEYMSSQSRGPNGSHQTGVQASGPQNPNSQGPSLQDVGLENPNLQNPNPQNPNPQNPNPQNPNLQNPNLQESNLQHPDLQNPNLQSPNRPHPNFHNPNLESPTLQGPGIRQVNDGNEDEDESDDGDDRNDAAPAHAASTHAPPAHATRPHATAPHATPQHAAPAHEAPAHEAPAHEAPAHEAPAHEAPAHTTPAHAAAADPAADHDPSKVGGADAPEAQMEDSPIIELVLANGTKFSQTGWIGAIEANFNNETGNIAFRADFPNPDGLLRHGQTGKVVIQRKLKGAIVIPQRAVFEILAKRYVYVVDKDDKVHQREIVIQNELEDIFVIKQGLRVDEKIVLEGVRQVHEDEKVEFEFLAPEKALAHLKFKAE